MSKLRAALLMLVSVAGCLSGPPSDQELIDNLRTHRATFEQLVRMIQQDAQLERVDNDWMHSWTRPDDLAGIGVSAARLAEYHRLLRDANIPRGFYSFDGGARISFVAYATGLSVSGMSKGYAYSREPHEVAPGPSLDALHTERKAADARAVDPHWGLEFTSD